MSDLKVDSHDLEETGTALRLLAGELRDAERIVEDYSRDIGHQELTHQLDEMQGTWDDRRNDLLQSIGSLADAATQAGQAFEDIEQHLVAALAGN